MNSKILVIDDELTILENIKFVLELENYEVLITTDSENAITIFRENHLSIGTVICDMRMPKLTGMDVLKEVKSISPEMCVIILTGHGDMENAIHAMKAGAYEYLSKPVDADKLNIAVNNAIIRKNILKDNKKMYEEILEHRNYLKGLHDSAQKILLNLVPSSLPSINGYSISAKYQSSEEVGGDLFNVIDTRDYLCFYVFDVTNHGILASVISVILSSNLQNIQNSLKDTVDTQTFCNFLSELNIKLLNNTAQNIFASLFIGFINKNDNTLYYLSAGHITQYIIRDNLLIPLNSTGPILGAFEDSTFDCKKISILHKDKILLFTDGIIEVENNGVLIQNNKIEDELIRNAHNNIDNTIKNLYNLSNNYCDGRFLDDITILGLEKI